MPVSFKSCLQTSLNRKAGRPVSRRPEASSPYMTSFGMRPSSIRCTCPSHCKRHWQSMRCILREPAFSSTAVLVTLSCHVMPENSSETANVEAFQAVLLSGVCRPGFTAIQQATEHAYLVDCTHPCMLSC